MLCDLAVAAIPIAALTACGGGGDDPNTPIEAVAPAPSPAPAPAPSPGPAPAPSPAPAPPPASSPPDASTGRLLYQTHCLRCHGLPPDRRALSAVADPSFILQAIAFVRPMNALAASIRFDEANHIAVWLQDPR
jgi:mono/diheme cytochrome c family protein